MKKTLQTLQTLQSLSFTLPDLQKQGLSPVAPAQPFYHLPCLICNNSFKPGVF